MQSATRFTVCDQRVPGWPPQAPTRRGLQPLYPRPCPPAPTASDTCMGPESDSPEATGGLSSPLPSSPCFLVGETSPCLTWVCLPWFPHHHPLGTGPHPSPVFLVLFWPTEGAPPGGSTLVFPGDHQGSPALAPTQTCRYLPLSPQSALSLRSADVLFSLPRYLLLAGHRDFRLILSQMPSAPIHSSSVLSLPSEAGISCHHYSDSAAAACPLHLCLSLAERQRAPCQAPLPPVGSCEPLEGGDVACADRRALRGPESARREGVC